MPSSASPPPKRAPGSEAAALRLSLVATSVLAVLGLGWGLISDAGVVLFIAVYLLASVVLVSVSMVAARAASTAPSPKYPFGRHAATPLATALQGATLVGTLVYGLVQSARVFIEGGSDAPPYAIYGFGVLLAGVSLIVVLVLRRTDPSAVLARVELTAWRVRLVIGVVLIVGGLLAEVLNGQLARLVDPVLVLATFALIFPRALTLVRAGVRELLEASPAPRLQTNIEHAVATGMAEVADPAGGRTLPVPAVRAAKLGQRLYVEVQFVVEPGLWRVEDEDAVREAIAANLTRVGLDAWTTVVLTTDPSQ